MIQIDWTAKVRSRFSLSTNNIKTKILHIFQKSSRFSAKNGDLVLTEFAAWSPLLSVQPSKKYPLVRFLGENYINTKIYNLRICVRDVYGTICTYMHHMPKTQGQKWDRSLCLEGKVRPFNFNSRYIWKSYILRISFQTGLRDSLIVFVFLFTLSPLQWRSLINLI